MFKARTGARTALLDPRFPTRALGVAALLIDYDPVAWLRCPVLGEDRTEWHDRSLAAISQDWSLRPGGRAYQILDNVLNRTADDPLSHQAAFLSIRKPGDGTAMVFVDVADEEVTLLEHGDPDRWLAFDDLFDEPGIVVDAPHGQPRTVDTQLRETARTSGDAEQMMVRAHRRILSDPETHLAAFGFLSQPKMIKRLAAADQLIESIRVETTDGQLL